VSGRSLWGWRLQVGSGDFSPRDRDRIYGSPRPRTLSCGAHRQQSEKAPITSFAWRPPHRLGRRAQGLRSSGKVGSRPRSPRVEVIRREVLAKHRRALVIYGGGHLFRASQSLVRPLEDIAKVRVFTIATATSTRFEDLVALQPNATSWHAPSLATIRGTALEAKQLGYYDALLYLGPPSAMTMSQLSPTLCSDRNYVEMRLWRLAVGPKSGIARFKRDCELPP